MRTAYYETKCGGLTVERRSRRSRTEAQRRKLVRVRENIGAAMMLLGFLLLMVIGGAEDLTVIFLGGLAGLSLMLLGGWLGHAFYGQEKGRGMAAAGAGRRCILTATVTRKAPGGRVRNAGGSEAGRG